MYMNTPRSPWGFIILTVVSILVSVCYGSYDPEQNVSREQPGRTTVVACGLAIAVHQRSAVETYLWTQVRPSLA